MIELQRRLSVHWPLWIALAVLWMLTVTFEYLATLRTQGKLIYTLDDAYIHMAMAKNIALHGVYGVTRYEFSSSSSSPLWTLLLGLFYWTFGVRETLPLVLDLLISSAALGAVYFTLRRKIVNNYWMALILLAVVVLTPMPVLISSGMEHPLHIVLVILFAGLFGKTMDDDEALRKPSNVIFLCLLCAGLVMTRFESYAIVFIAVVFTLFRGRWKTAFGMAASAVLPLVVYQAISVAHGSRWLPNSILIRGDVHHTGIFNSAESVLFVPLSSPNFRNFILGWWHGFILAPYLGALVGASALVLAISWFRSKKFWKSEHVLLLTYVAAAAAHLQFGRTGHFYRYDAYLVTLGIFVLSIPLSEVFASLVRWMVKNVSRTLIGSVAILLSLQMLFPLMTRSFLAFPLIPAASRNIYEQQYQMGLFLKRYYQGKAVAANDIGAITFLADIRLLDIVGLASADICRLRQSDELTAERVCQIANGMDVSIAMVYEVWAGGEGLTGLQQMWKKVGAWKIHDNVVCRSDVVTFFATLPSDAGIVRQQLRAFTEFLPPAVEYWESYATDSDSTAAKSAE